MSLNVGTLCYATDQGLGILAKSFFKHGIVTHPIIVRHGRNPNHLDWYPTDTPVIADLRRDVLKVVEPLLKQVQVMLFFETPFAWEILPLCKRYGVKTVLMPMYECDLENPPHQFDAYFCPSLLDVQYYGVASLGSFMGQPFKPFSEWYGKNGVSVHFTPVPVDESIPWRKRERAEVFVHNAGHGGLRGRNGTAELYTSLQYVKSKNVQLILRYQERVDNHLPSHATTATVGNVTVSCRPGNAVYESLWEEGDVFVFPEKFNGLSLPLQEARAAGMLVMAGDRFPMNSWLPREPLIPLNGEVTGQRIGPPYQPFTKATYNPRAIAAKIDEYVGSDISGYSESGREWAETMSWEVLGPKYRELLETLL